MSDEKTLDAATADLTAFLADYEHKCRKDGEDDRLRDVILWRLALEDLKLRANPPKELPAFCNTGMNGRTITNPTKWVNNPKG
jgi:hypothetical protein